MEVGGKQEPKEGGVWLVEFGYLWKTLDLQGYGKPSSESRFLVKWFRNLTTNNLIKLCLPIQRLF